MDNGEQSEGGEGAEEAVQRDPEEAVQGDPEWREGGGVEQEEKRESSKTIRGRAMESAEHETAM